jgi:hypothetical protein
MTDPVAPTPAPTPAPVAGVKQTLSIVAFVVGLVAFVFGWTPVFGLLAGVAAIILAVMAHKREPAAPAWMWIVGLIAGILGAVTSLIFSLVWIFSLIAIAAAPGVYGY